jgi:ribosome maturation protein SDO1
MIEQALQEIHFSPNLTKNAKAQALETIKLLEQQSKLPIARAQMRLQVEVAVKDLPGVLELLIHHAASTDATKPPTDDVAPTSTHRFTCLIDPGQYRPVIEAVGRITKGAGIVNLVSLRDVKESDGPSQSRETGH